MEKERYVVIDGEKIPVSEDVYRAYYRPVWREAKQRAVREDMEYSLDALEDSGVELDAGDKLTENIVEDQLLLDTLLSAISALPDEERNLIFAHYYQDKTERELASDNGFSKTKVHKLKCQALEKLRKFFP